MSLPELKVLPTPAAVAQAAAERIVQLCRQTLEDNDTFALCLAGGSTPKATYEKLASDEFRPRIEWPRVEIFFGDERTVPPDHADSNFAMAKAALLDHVPIPGDNINRMKGELDPETAAKAYGELLKDRFGDTGGVDLLLLGMGDDAHTLSLFPGTAAINELKHRCVANHVPQHDTWRITITTPFANRSGHAMALITGKNKAKALQDVLEGDRDPNRYPLQLIDPGKGRLSYYLDAAAVDMDAE